MFYLFLLSDELTKKLAVNGKSNPSSTDQVLCCSLAGLLQRTTAVALLGTGTDRPE